ncbi:thiaminase II [Limoniibacter endophyticus]|uniref:Aminopyrimidine aminohydrolase n=1 Tax=Limoniibacter endophyticus TaxID=1565040 RepID=A0A8J3DEK7_9HYPH|nr:thiaminase II [Limoniibacter endophyticus]GHC63774.1 aminopyrimidine aminohydrolase [Limoniibacter endophyticus]
MPQPSFQTLTQACSAEWRAYCQHSFVQQLADGSLPKESFQHYLKQDYLFLIHFSRAWALAIYKSRSLAEMRAALDSLKTIMDVELGLHVGYCQAWGIAEDALETLPEARATTAYTRYVLDTGLRGDLLDLHVALAPCIIGYGVIAKWVEAQPGFDASSNPYASWAAMYAGEDYQKAMNAELTWLDGRLAHISDQRLAELARIFAEASRLEADFWQMGLDLAA